MIKVNNTFMPTCNNLYFNKACQKNNLSKFNDGLYRNDYYNAFIKESLSTYYAVQYCIKYNLPTSFFSPIKDYHPLIHKETGYLMIKNNTHFNDIFTHAIKSIDNALRILLENNEKLYYEIINRDIYIKELEKQIKTLME